MCVSNPRIELATIWYFTYEEILHRWDIWKKFDIVTRIFGTGDKEEKKEDTPAPVTNATFAALANMFGPNAIKQTPAPEE